MIALNISLQTIEMAEMVSSGGFVSEYEVVELKGKSIADLAESADQWVYAIITFKMLKGTVNVDGQILRLSSERFDVSPYNYLDGDVYTLEQVKAMNGDKTLIANMESNDWSHVIRCRTGNWQSFEPDRGDIVLTTI